MTDDPPDQAHQPGALVRHLAEPRRHGETATYNNRPPIWGFRLLAAPMLLIGLGFLAQPPKSAPSSSRGVLLLIGALVVMFGVAAIVWSTKVGVHVTSAGVRNVNFSSRPTFHPWAQIDHFDYGRSGSLYRTWLVATNGSRTQMRMLNCWPYQRNLGQAYCNALNAELEQHRAQP